MKNEASEENKIVEFVYRYSDHEGQYQEATINIRIPYEDECLQELVTELLNQMGVMMRYVDENVKITKALQQFIGVENQKARDEYAEKMFKKIYNNECDIEEIVRNTEKHYKEELIKFADRIGPTDENIFAQSFHRLVHSSFLEEILKRERAYAETISNMTKVMDKEVESLNNSQQEEMDLSINQLDITTTSDDINYLLAQQYSTQNFVRKRYESELEAKKGHQRNEYRDWIISQVNRLFQTSPVTTPLGNRSSMFISQQPSIEESFTIHLGSQLKHMHNIRILSANINDLCSPLYVDESLNGMNMALGVYSSSLCGVVVLTSQFQPYSNKDIIKNANMSTELHFDQIDNQFEKIEQKIRHINMNSASPTPSTLSVCTVSADYSIASGTDEISSGGNSGKSSANASPMKSNANLHTGDFFITKHSNLSQSHVIFHLISDEPLNSPSEINSRHPVLLGLRNILKIASRHDVTMLTIPALLRHEMSEDMTVQWCIRRAELVFKCVKGFMIESASWGGAELSTLQLLLPHDISEELFSTLSSMVPNVFRLANPKILVDTHK